MEGCIASSFKVSSVFSQIQVQQHVRCSTGAGEHLCLFALEDHRRVGAQQNYLVFL